MAHFKRCKLRAKVPSWLRFKFGSSTKHKETQKPSRNSDHADHPTHSKEHIPETELPSPLPAHVKVNQKIDPSHSTVDTATRAESLGGQEQKQIPSCAPEPEKAHDLWQDAFELTDGATKELIKKHLSRSSNDHQKNELVRTVQEKEAEFKDKSARITIRGREFTWSADGQRIIGHIIDIGDIAIQFAPSPASIVWSGLKVLLNTHVNQCQDLIAVFGCADIASTIIKRGQIYEKFYLEATSGESAEILRSALIEVYQGVMRLMAHAANYLEKNGAQRFLTALQHPNESDVHLQRLSDAEKRLDSAAQTCMAVQSQQVLDTIQGLNVPLRLMDRKIAEIYESAQEEDLIEALNFISAIKFNEQHEKRQSYRTEGTCEWLLQHDNFQSWNHANSPPILWLTGSLGAGKSILTSRVIDYCKSRTSGQGFAFFYFSKTDPETQVNPAAHILQSFVRQIATVAHQPEKVYAGLVDQCRQLRKDTKSFNLELCKNKILEIAGNLQQTTLVLDGLDELPHRDMQHVVSTLSDLAKTSPRPLKVFISSRDEDRIHQKIQNSWGHLTHINIKTENQKDIEKFVTERARNVGETLGGEIGPDRWSKLEAEIVSAVCRSANGMFRYAFLQMEELDDPDKCHNEEGVNNLLSTLPPTITVAYDRLYDAVGETYQKYLRRAIQWTMYAHRPLSTEEILSAVQTSLSVNGGVYQVKLDKPRLTEANLKNICRQLIVNDRGEWKFAHASVQEYFLTSERFRTWIGDDSLAELAKTAVVLLTSYNWQNKKHQQQDLNHLQRYVGVFWARHVTATQHIRAEYAQLAALLKPFVKVRDDRYHPSLAYQYWVEYFCRLKEASKALGGLDQSVQEQAKCLQPADNSEFGIVALGLFPMVEYWGEDSFNLRIRNDNGNGLLLMAMQFEQQETLDRLKELAKKMGGPGGGPGTNAMAAAVAVAIMEQKERRAREDASNATHS